MAASLPFILMVGLNVIFDFVKSLLFARGKKELWDQYSPVIPQICALVGFVASLILALVYSTDFGETALIFGLNVPGALGAVGLDMAMKGDEKEDESKVFFNTFSIKK